MKSKFGGLNLLSGSTVLPTDDSPSLLNMDFDISGSVYKRKGTVTVFKDEASAYPVSVDSFITQLGRQFFASKYGLQLRVLDLIGDTSTLIWSKANVFRDLSILPYPIALEDNTILLLAERHAPIQMRILEHEVTVPTTVTSLTLRVGKEWVNSYVDAVCYIDGVRTTVSSSFSVDSITISGVTFSVDSNVYLVTFNWQWWAESLVWYGDSYYQRQSRFGVSEDDKHVQIPNSIVTDEIPNSTQYGVYAYYSETFDERYSYKSDNQPKISVDYSFSDGSSYTPSTKSFTNPSKFFITFGDITNVNERTFTDKEVTGDVIRIVKHKLKDFDIVSLTNTDGDVPSGTSSGTFYYVKYITDDTIELYSDSALTSIVSLGSRNSQNFTDLAVDYTSNFIGINAHGFYTGQPIRFTSSNTLPVGLNETTTYYANAISADAFEVFFDQKLRKKFITVARNELFFNNTNVSGDILTISQHNLFVGDAVRLRTANGTLPATVNDTSVYFVNSLTADAIQLYYDAALTSIVPNYTGLTGDIFLYLDGGVHTVIADGLTTTVKRVAYDSVSFIRLRQLRFNKDSGILPIYLDVYVDEDAAIRNISSSPSLDLFSYYTHSSETITPDFSSDIQKFVSFSAKTPIGVDKDSMVMLINKETKWCGSAALPTKFNYDNGSYVAAFGIGDYADYLNGEFPTFGTLYQNRLCLCGVGSPFIVSGVYDKIIRNAPYRYFQISDDLSNPLIDPFRVRIPLNKADRTTAIQQWQQYLFVFTDTAVYRTALDSNGQYNTSVNSLLLSANVGCIGRDCLAVTDNTIMFLSDGGVFDMAVILQNEYRASEVSVTIRPALKKFTSKAFMVYDSFNKKLFLYDERLFVYYSDAKVWSEWGASIGWGMTSMTTSREAAIFCCRAQCDFQIVKTEYSKYIDFAKMFDGGSTILVQPCVKRIPSYGGVANYKSPIPFISDNTVEDILIRYNSIPIRYGADWVKLEDGYIKLTNPQDGQLTFSPIIDSSFYGVVGYQDNVKMSLSDSSFGIIEPANICTEKFTVYYVSLNVTYGDGTTFSLSNTEYSSYADLVSVGTLPIDVETIYKTDGFTTIESFSRLSDVTLKPAELRVVVDTVGKPFTAWTLSVELWSTSSPIEFNRFIERQFTDGVTPITFAYINGNPSDRTTIGVLQPNGLYKGNVNINVNFGAQPEAHFTVVYNANSVPLKPTFTVTLP